MFFEILNFMLVEIYSLKANVPLLVTNILNRGVSSLETKLKANDSFFYLTLIAVSPKAVE